MTLRTFDEILTELCDDFDALIAPRTISRSNVNIIYLLLKSIAKGYEVINNTCYAVHSKFDPANCEASDLDSVASIVGTERLLGSGSGLTIRIQNDTDADITLPVGMYSYVLDEDTTFKFEIVSEYIVPAKSVNRIIAMSESVGSYPVTTQSSITVTADREEVVIPADLSFSCMDNSGMLGTADETDVEFRTRILQGVDRQNTMVELQTRLRNLPYLYDARVIFNNTLITMQEGDVTIPSFYCAILYSGSYRQEMADLIAGYIMGLTVETDDSTPLYYESDVFCTGRIQINLIPFRQLEIIPEITYIVDEGYTTIESVNASILSALSELYQGNTHVDYVTESEVYTTVTGLNLAGVTILNVDLLYNGETVRYLEIPKTACPVINSVAYNRVIES